MFAAPRKACLARGDFELSPHMRELSLLHAAGEGDFGHTSAADHSP